MIPPPQGYKLVTNAEIPIVPEGAMFWSDSHEKWFQSFKVGNRNKNHSSYAIPIPASEPQAELITKSQAELIARWPIR